MNNNSSDRKSSFVIGRKPVLEFLKHRSSDVIKCFVAKNITLPAELQRALEINNVQCSVQNRDSLFQMCGSSNHQGIVLEIRDNVGGTVTSIIETALSVTGTGLIVLCDHIEDPQNLGAIVRVSEASGADGVIVTKARSAPLSVATERASAGATHLLPVAQVSNLHRTLQTLKKNGFWIVGLAVHENTHDLFHADIPYPCAVVLGSEGSGLKQLTIKECDLTVAIPMQGSIESLNVSQAASVFLFEMLRRRLLKG